MDLAPSIMAGVPPPTVSGPLFYPWMKSCGRLEDRDESTEMVLRRRTPQSGGTPRRPVHRRALRTRGRSGLPGHLGGPGPEVRLDREPTDSCGQREGRALPRVHA